MAQLTKAIDYWRLFLHSCKYSQQHRHLHTHTQAHKSARNFCNFHHYTSVAIIIGSRSRNSCRNMHQLTRHTLTHTHTNTHINEKIVICSWIRNPFLNSVRFICTRQHNDTTMQAYYGTVVQQCVCGPFLCDWFSVLASNGCQNKWATHYARKKSFILHL